MLFIFTEKKTEKTVKSVANLLFLEDKHRYILEGEEFPSVSELCRFISIEMYRDVPQWRLDEASKRGKSVHKACEILDKYGTADVSDDILPYMQAYLKFRKEHDVNWEKIEYATYNPKLKYAGRIDRYGKIDGKFALLDLKTTYFINKPTALAELNFYSKMMEANNFKVEILYILQLKKEGTYKLKKFDFNDEVVNACLILHELLKKKSRKNK